MPLDFKRELCFIHSWSLPNQGLQLTLGETSLVFLKHAMRKHTIQSPEKSANFLRFFYALK